MAACRAHYSDFAQSALQANAFRPLPRKRRHSKCRTPKEFRLAKFKPEPNRAPLECGSLTTALRFRATTLPYTKRKVAQIQRCARTFNRTRRSGFRPAGTGVPK